MSTDIDGMNKPHKLPWEMDANDHFNAGYEAGIDEAVKRARQFQRAEKQPKFKALARKIADAIEVLGKAGAQP
jgi:hypothetical protein